MSAKEVNLTWLIRTLSKTQKGSSDTTGGSVRGFPFHTIVRICLHPSLYVVTDTDCAEETLD